MSNITNEPQALTSNGEENKIFNGITDWVYEGQFVVHNGSSSSLLQLMSQPVVKPTNKQSNKLTNIDRQIGRQADR